MKSLNSYRDKLFNYKKSCIEMKGICGLGNLGNSCYINATLQILSQIDELNDYLLEIDQSMHNIPDTVVVLEWTGLVKMIQENHCSILPHRFIENIRMISSKKNRPEFSSNEQNDSVEFFEYMMECIHNSLNLLDHSVTLQQSGCLQVDNYFKKMMETDCSIVSTLFVGCMLNQYINPITKKVEFYKLEHNHKIELSIPEKKDRERDKEKCLTLYDCFIETFKEDSLHGENAWYDETAKQKKNVLKRCALAYTPSILCLHLKRWRHNLSKHRIKIVSPFLLDLTPFTIYKEKQSYELFGIINHEGGIKGGHYYSYILREKQWFSMNDQIVRPISSDEVIHESNYCLFYRKIK